MAALNSYDFMMRILICDDDTAVLNLLMKKIKDFAPEALVECFESGEVLLNALTKSEETADAVFMDILLNNANGIEIAADIISKHPEIKVIFITGYGDRYFENVFLSVKPWAFMQKPIKDQLLTALLNEIKTSVRVQSKYLNLKIKGFSVDAPFENILYLESDKRIVHVYADGQIYDVYGKLDDFHSKLDERFIRCHKSYIVNLDFIASLEESNLFLRNGVEINISKAYRHEAKSRYFKFKGRAIK